MEDFIPRLENLMEYYGLTASSFADRIGVQRSSISHLLSGRNKPSLDFILKITDAFPEVDLYWLLNGKGHLVKEQNSSTPPPIYAAAAPDNSIPVANAPGTTVANASPDSDAVRIPPTPQQQLPITAGAIETIVIFYKDGSFKEYGQRTV